MQSVSMELISLCFIRGYEIKGWFELLLDSSQKPVILIFPKEKFVLKKFLSPKTTHFLFFSFFTRE